MKQRAREKRRHPQGGGRALEFAANPSAYLYLPIPYSLVDNAVESGPLKVQGLAGHAVALLA